MSVSRVGSGAALVVVDEERADEAAAEVGQREALRLEAVVGVADADDEVDERQVRVAAVDRERRDARADDDREREEALADDLAERLEGPDALADALEPPVGADGVEVELAAGPWSFIYTAVQRAYQNRVPCPVNAHGFDAAPLAADGVAARRAALEHAQVAEGEVVLDGVGGSKRARAAVISSVVFHEGSLRRVRPRFRASLWMWTSTGTSRRAGSTSQRPRSTPSAGRTIQRRKRSRRLLPLGPRGVGQQVGGPPAAAVWSAERRRPSGWRRTRRARASRRLAVRSSSALEAGPERAVRALHRARPRRAAARGPRPRKTRCFQPRRRRRAARRSCGDRRRGSGRAARAGPRAWRGWSSRCRTRCTRPTSATSSRSAAVRVAVGEGDGVGRATGGDVAAGAHGVERRLDRLLARGQSSSHVRPVSRWGVSLPARLPAATRSPRASSRRRLAMATQGSAAGGRGARAT